MLQIGNPSLHRVACSFANGMIHPEWSKKNFIYRKLVDVCLELYRFFWTARSNSSIAASSFISRAARPQIQMQLLVVICNWHHTLNVLPFISATQQKE